MNKLAQLQRIKEIYQKGGNLMEYLRGDSGHGNDIESIMISYDFQAGSYIRNAETNKEYFDKYTTAISEIIKSFGEINSIMEVGVGEATVMSPLLKKLKDQSIEPTMLGFDISWSRIKFAKEYSRSFGLDPLFFTANLFNIPLPDSSVDVVYTSHSLEPNGGKEKEALIELFRVAAKYVLLLEPGYEFATEEGKARMKRLGYIQDIDKHASELGFEIVRHSVFPHTINPLNPTAITVLRKMGPSSAPILVCPITKLPLQNLKGALYSEDGLLVYPVIDTIPCLLADNAILAAHFKD